MTKRKPDTEEVPKREPKKKTAGANFSNIRLEPHPASILFGLAQPLDAQAVNPLDAQRSQTTDAQKEKPLGVQIVETTDAQQMDHLDAQNLQQPDAPQLQPLDAQPVTLDARTPERPVPLDAQTPSAKNLGVQLIGKLDAQKSKDRKDGRTRHHLRIRNAISQQFTQFCEAKKIPLQDFLELAGVHFLECVAAQSLLNLDAQTPHDDLKIFKTREDIISAYEGLTGNKWRARDDEAGVLFAEADLRCIEIGMLNTCLNFKGKRINSFRYFRAEIEEMVDVARETKMQDQTIDILLRRRRQQWDQKRAADQDS